MKSSLPSLSSHHRRSAQTDLDYFLRDLQFLKLASDKEIRTAIRCPQVIDGRIVVDDPDAARWLAYTYIEADRTSWSNVREVRLYQLTAEAIKAANRHGLIADADLWSSDGALWRKLKTADHPEVRRWVDRITPGTRFARSDEDPQFRVSTKIRSINPPVTDGSSVTPLSVLDPVFARYRRDYLTSKQGEWPMAVVNAPPTTA